MILTNADLIYVLKFEHKKKDKIQNLNKKTKYIYLKSKKAKQKLNLHSFIYQMNNWF